MDSLEMEKDVTIDPHFLKDTHQHEFRVVPTRSLSWKWSDNRHPRNGAGKWKDNVSSYDFWLPLHFVFGTSNPLINHQDNESAIKTLFWKLSEDIHNNYACWLLLSQKSTLLWIRKKWKQLFSPLLSKPSGAIHFPYVDKISLPLYYKFSCMIYEWHKLWYSMIILGLPFAIIPFHFSYLFLKMFL